MPTVSGADAPILLVDDEEQALQSYELTLRYGGHPNAVRCQDPRKAAAFVKTNDISLAVLDLCMPHLGGEELLALIRSARPDAPVIVVTGENEVETAVRCMRAGAADYLVKPVDPPRFMQAVTSALALHRGYLRLAQAGTAENAAVPGAFVHIVHASEQMSEVCRYIAAIAASREPVLITGETGVGKEMAAQAIHHVSRGRTPFVAVNAAGLDDAVFADSLFGHRKGAFTGAEARREGLIGKAEGGSLFLDEIGDLSHASQLKLLRLLEEREYFPVGADECRTTDARVIAATNRSLEELLDPARFRSDLFYRLRTHHIHLPSLRERPADVAPLSEHYLAKASAKFGKPFTAVPGDVAALLSAYDFPGNVRELRAMIFDAVARSGPQRLDADVFRAWTRATGPVDQTGQAGVRDRADGPCCPLPTLRQAEEELILRALEQAGGKQSEAARILGISRQALNKRLLTRKREPTA
ncbi:MAG: sigma-54-dependent Fis family transcriptional regulator [Desulfovibrionaceae bacterium]|nr:sigma-54-dependent Fis family transcriptional regulator [Desulfovibrionaceae bacterium]MBF0513393.1 sigma-54-dependent Fis family transcriptional regulator [Desulfovibrionaceae bacterium]